MPTTLANAHEALRRIDERHEQYYETLLDDFRRELNREVVQAVAALVDSLKRRLAFDVKGRVAWTLPNRRILAKIDDEFDSLMERFGYQQSIDTLVQQFPGQLPFLREEFAIINTAINRPLIEGPLLAGPDLSALLAQQQLTRSNLIDVSAMVGDLARRKVLLSLNALNVDDLTEMLSKSLSRTTTEAHGLAATSATMFYRTAYSRVIDRISKDDSRKAIRFTYDGPRDILNRPFCRHLVDKARSGSSWTKDEIENMDNGQLPNPWITAGGWSCRHQWRIALEDETA